MKYHTIHTPSTWTTSAFGGSADTLPGELTALGEHLDHCRRETGRMFNLQCIAEHMNGFVASRFVTTLVLLVTLGIGLGSMLV